MWRVITITGVLLVAAALCDADGGFCFKKCQGNGGICARKVGNFSGGKEDCCALHPDGGHSQDLIAAGRKYQCEACKPEVEDTPVTGVWAEWTSWSCSLQAVTRKTRVCIEEGGCKGRSQKKKFPPGDCPLRRDGAWGPWMPWSACSVTCGAGFAIKVRECNNPSPRAGGARCDGVHYAKTSCHMKPCPVDGYWGPWTEWSACPVTCGGGIRSRQHSECVGPQFGGEKCPGPLVETKRCNTVACPTWTEWSAWSVCAIDGTCGDGTRDRRRSCVKAKASHECIGRGYARENCSNPCPIDGGWTTWSGYERRGNHNMRMRTRHCTNPTPMHGGAPCAGPPFEMKIN